MSTRKHKAEMAAVQRKFEHMVDQSVFEDNFERMVFAEVFSLVELHEEYGSSLYVKVLSRTDVHLTFNSHRGYTDDYVFTKTMDYEDFIDAVCEFKRDTTYFVAQREEERRLAELARTALAKLTAEEREALGL